MNRYRPDEPQPWGWSSGYAAGIGLLVAGLMLFGGVLAASLVLARISS